MRNQYKELFEKKHGVKLGFMGFFVRACIQALKEIPAVNAEIDGTDIVYKNYYHIGVAVGTERGLVVPVVRDADHLSLAGIEKAINDFGKRARDGAAQDRGDAGRHLHHLERRRLRLADVDADPERAAVRHPRHAQDPGAPGGASAARSRSRPMMYLALSYDHRIVDGREAVTFLVRVKEVWKTRRAGAGFVVIRHAGLVRPSRLFSRRSWMPASPA